MGQKKYHLLKNDPDNIIFATWDFHCAYDGLNTRPTNTPSMIIRPSPKKLRGRYEQVEFDVPGVVRTKRCRMDITLDFVTKEVADAYGPTLERLSGSPTLATLPRSILSTPPIARSISRAKHRRWRAQRWPVLPL
jgi:hypothetical protein